MKNVKTRIYSIFGVEFKSMKNKNAILLRYSCDTNVTSGRCLNEISEGTNMRCTHEKGDMTKNANVVLKIYSRKHDMSHLLLLGKFEYGGGPIFKVVLEC